MHVTLKAKWISALRSGEYQQGKKRLRSGDVGNYTYCCLGVLSEIAGLGFHSDLDGTAAATETCNGYDLIDPLIGGEANKYKLAKMNDLDGQSFSEIADWIESNL